ncbi:MAG: translocation/assembly module TamB domain-containing protein, partial [Flavisolibacter sp.]|nr:translocation/assembly module TamB domain-containing protein [Flavisolibacter sp.]
YVANTAPLDLVQDQLQASQIALRNSYFLQKLPFEVHLQLTGELMTPKIDFDIILPDRNYVVDQSVIQIVDIRLQQLRQEPSELNKQVFALLLLGRFIQENPFQSSGEGFSASDFARQSVSRILTDQLNQLAAGLIHGVDVNFGIQSTDDYLTGERRTRTDLNVQVSKQLLNDRLTVTLGRQFGLDGDQSGNPAANPNANNIIGDLSVNYKLSKDGRYMLRAYRRNEYEGVIQGYIIETGIGFSINVDFNSFSEIFNRKKANIKGLEEANKHRKENVEESK